MKQLSNETITEIVKQQIEMLINQYVPVASCPLKEQQNKYNREQIKNKIKNTL